MERSLILRGTVASHLDSRLAREKSSEVRIEFEFFFEMVKYLNGKSSALNPGIFGRAFKSIVQFFALENSRKSIGRQSVQFEGVFNISLSVVWER